MLTENDEKFGNNDKCDEEHETYRECVKFVIGRCFVFSELFHDLVDYPKSKDITNTVKNLLIEIKECVEQNEDARNVLKTYLKDSIEGHLELVIVYGFIYRPDETDPFYSYTQHYSFGSFGKVEDYLNEEDDDVMVKPGYNCEINEINKMK